MIPFTFPSQPSVVSGNAECKVWYLSSVVGMARWIDYIPVRQIATASPIEGRTDAGGYQAVTLLSSTSGLAAWTDYIPVYEDSSATVAWGTGADGYIPVGSAGAALSLQMLGTNTLDSRITFTRASSGTHFGSTVRLVTDGNNMARFDYDPATLLPRGLLIEEQRTNLLLHSRDMTQAAWSKTDVTAARTQVGIDGVASSACLMTEGSAGTANASQTGGAVTAGSTITGSVVVKRGNTDWVRVRVSESTATDGANVYFNLNTGVKGTTSAFGVGTNISSTITPLGGGWYRLTLTVLPNGTYVLPLLFLASAAGDGNGTRVANATYIVDCAQLEVGAFATSPIITGAATATRAADSASMTGTNFSSWFNATQGTFVVEYSRYQNVDAFGMVLEVKATSTPTADRICIQASASADPRLQQFIGGVSQIDTNNTYGVLAANTVVKAVLAYLSGDSAATRNAGSVTTSATTFAAPAYTNLQIGQTDNNQYGPTVNSPINGHIRSIRFYSARLPNATLQALTS